jgi:hypothetical protein
MIGAPFSASGFESGRAETETAPQRVQFVPIAFHIAMMQKAPARSPGLFSRIPLLGSQTLVRRISLPLFRWRQRHCLVEHGLDKRMIGQKFMILGDDGFCFL